MVFYIWGEKEKIMFLVAQRLQPALSPSFTTMLCVLYRYISRFLKLLIIKSGAVITRYHGF